MTSVLLRFRQEGLEFFKGPAPMADAVFEFLGHFRVRLPLPLVGLEDGIPAKVGRATGSYNFAVCSPIEHVNVFAGAAGVRHDGLGVGRPVVEAIQHLVQPRMAAVIQEPFDVRPIIRIKKN
jgi:hypothetical protein